MPSDTVQYRDALLSSLYAPDRPLRELEDARESRVPRVREGGRRVDGGDARRSDPGPDSEMERTSGPSSEELGEEEI
jgi:hypothetical protein